MKGKTIELTEDQYDCLDSIRNECLHADLPGIIIGQFFGYHAVVNFIPFEKALIVIRALDPEKYKKAIEYVEEEFGVQVILGNKESEGK